MGKRSSRPHKDGSDAYRKRQKITHNVPTGEQVWSSSQLRELLAFDQDLNRGRHGLQSFKLLLDEIQSQSDDRRSKLAVLKEYLESVKPKRGAVEDDDDDEADVYLMDIMETWSFASQTNNEGVMSSVAVVLALVLQAVSSSLELVPHGTGICKTLLHERQLKSLAKNLSVEKSKGFVLSPTLRLLREAACFDGGVFAKGIFRARQSSFASLGRNLEIGLAENYAKEDAHKTSVRTNAVRFFLSCLQHLHSDGRRELLSQRDLMSHLTFLLRGDPAHLVIEILDSLKRYALMDDKIPRDVKFRNFNTKLLLRVLPLYAFSASSPEENASVANAAHEFLLYTCTSPSAGILHPSTGQYPKEAASQDQGVHGAASAFRAGDGEEDAVSVYNFVLSEFAAKLKPWSSLKHSELLVAIFKAAPELVADYFHNTRAFTFEPRLSMTWIGYAAFLFNTMALPLPPSFGDRSRFSKSPPPLRILLDNVIPPPVNQKVLQRCLLSKSHLISFFATRILVLAIEKLAVAVRMLNSQASVPDGTRWREASRQLVDGFCQRVPDMKELVQSYKSIPGENTLHKTMASRLLRLYYQVIPQVALAANFDVSPFFVNILKQQFQQDGGDRDDDDDAFVGLELENLVNIASFSPGMKWFTRVEKLSHGIKSSPYTALLGLLCYSSLAISPQQQQLYQVLSDMAVENQLFPGQMGLMSLVRALRSVRSLVQSEQWATIWSYLDNCINRCGSSPLKYLEQAVEAAVKPEITLQADSQVTTSLLSFSLLEQLPFVTKEANKQEKDAIVRFLSFYLNALSLSGEKSETVQQLHAKFSAHFVKDSTSLAKLGDQSEVSLLSQVPDMSSQEESSPAALPLEVTPLDENRLREMLHVPPDREADASTLAKWSTKDVDDLIDDDWIPRIATLLLSPHYHIRKEAHTALLHLAAKIKASPHEDKDQIWLLLSELAESTRALVSSSDVPSGGEEDSPVPSAFVAFTVHSLPVLRSPLHPLYPKLNSYLTSSPHWPLQKLPLAHAILHSAPSLEDKYYTELSFLLSYLLDALVKPQDLSTFRKKGWLEKVFALTSNPFLRQNLKSKVFRLVYRCTEIEGGCEVLITRFGTLSWLQAFRSGADAEDAALVGALMRRIWDNCNQGMVQRWSHGGTAKMMTAGGGKFDMPM